jgi:hypothetical protein
VSDDPTLGNDRYEGFIKDILDDIAITQGFNYRLELSYDSKYGSRNSETGEWNGLVQMAMRQEVDVIAADLTINNQRTEVLDFSKPFMASKLTVLMKRWPTPSSMDGWFAAYSWEVWLLLLLAYLVTGLVLWLVGRIAPKETSPSRPDTPLSLADSYWYLIACWFRASPFHPRAWSTRLLSCCWWMFYITMILIYFILLPPHIATPPPAATPSTANQLVESDAVFGLVHGGSTHQLLEQSRHPIHARIWESVLANTNLSMVSSYAEGYERVQTIPGYGLVMEDTGAKFLQGHDDNCNLYTVGDLQDRYFAFGFPKGARNRLPRKFSSSLLKIAEKGLLSAARHKWWPDNENCGISVPGNNNTLATTVLHIEDMGPPFIFLLVAIILSLLIALLELVYHLSTTTYANQEKTPSLGGSLKLACCPCLFPPKPVQNVYKPARPSVATQTVLWASSRATTPTPHHNLSQRIF